MERAGRDEQHVIRLDGTVFRRDLRAFDDRQDVALHAFARDVGPIRIAFDSDLVDLVEEDDAAALRDLDGRLRDFVHVDELARFFLREDLARLLDRDFALLAALRHEVAHHVLDVVAHALERRARKHADHRAARFDDVNLDEFFFELAVFEALAHPFTAGLVLRLLFFAVFLVVVIIFCAAEQAAERVLRFLRLRYEHVENALLGEFLRLFLHAVHALLAHHAHGRLDEVAHDGFDVAADVADFREFRRLDLDERRLDKLREAAGDLRLADARRADHEDVLRDDLVTHRARELAAAPAVAECDGDGALRLVLADDVLVELFDDLARRLLVRADFVEHVFRLAVCHYSSTSTLML